MFAAAALQGLLTKTVVDFGGDDIDATCKLAFRFADEMMKHTTENRMQRDAIQQASEMVARINERRPHQRAPPTVADASALPCQSPALCRDLFVCVPISNRYQLAQRFRYVTQQAIRRRKPIH